MTPLLAAVCPPLAVLLAGRPYQAAANVGLTLCLYLPGLVHALWVADRAATDWRNDTILRLDALRPA